MTTTIRTASWTAALALATLALSACDTFDRDGGDALSEPMSVSVRASNNEAAVGDTVTLVSETPNLVGGEPLP